jgi:isoamylase
VATYGPHPQGAHLVQGGAEFALYSEHATGVVLCLFDARGVETTHRITEQAHHVWHAFVPGIVEGQRYGFRVRGAYDPAVGDRFNPNKLVIDPYARAFEGKLSHGPAVFGYGRDDGEMDLQDSAPFVPKSVLVGEAFDWGSDASPRVPWEDTVIYEAHLKGFTQLHPRVPPELRGTYGGLGSEAAIAHLVALGVTAVELLPVHECLDEASVARRGQTNYWGYNTLGYFAPDQRFASRPGAQVIEFKKMVKALHEAGIEVILDVVFNHTAESDHLGPTVSFRGIDNRVYYQLKDPADRYLDFTGCGNTINVDHPQVLKLIVDSLRYWVETMHVDGFRFDLAPVLGREKAAFDPGAGFFDIVHTDPVLSRVKLIAEPWDLAPDNMQLGNFPAGWTEWNARFRDGARRFWNGFDRSLSDVGYRLTGSSDLFSRARGPLASVNFVTAHDGFTMQDLVSYAVKHNLPNGENDSDGTSDNLSTNFGVEGDTDDVAIVAARARQVRNFLATLLLLPGVPMITSGDELGKSQRGNNNPYCLDDAAAWLDWRLDETKHELLAFTQKLIALRGELPGLRRKVFFEGAEIVWRRADGEPMTDADWQTPRTMALAMLVPSTKSTLIVLMSAESAGVEFRLPDGAWDVLIDTRAASIPFGVTAVANYAIEARSFALLRVITTT